ncbi:praja ring finger 2, E3 ubiquitin protein ligase, transcript variant X2 [Columba livia]|uniref:Praja ring finger 2, E3 ubiquitin protein ligase, transcript variant X1 n=1 Tax=Columba livia TaxID=8932 RepID=A0A2I0M8U0_COLLI|nr:E3 ubiquitin-protein ligase Praja-2 isoform X1 [Columba livia]XP_013223707.1 E3 ubiquitin-protein ligase Praja-2 isoform X1 [Columba livia]XP_021148290.1 E3 ubiquitin-protein ligase Praja-2 isoform X1 [Columba livia]PKK26091.1 praja ring finger 2, E3 ubiquitin protein ligase, transcript variant X1 [Columba livia]PKK26092.1 praja ring finger 2, E3 ubiquitin protein ligase, transcript variant X3 [Columba livia]PKK26093.1 praja ring finger 2, E3 ubiquitin protein ligase, transcript variant X4 
MGQESAKPAWLKPAGGYQSATGRRYGRRHAFVGFRPSLNSQDRDEHQHNEDSTRLEFENVQRESSLSLREGSSPLVQVSSGLLDDPLLENTETEELACRSVSNRTSEANTSPFCLFSFGLEGNRISRNFMNSYGHSEDLAEYMSGRHNDLNGQNGIAFVNIDSYEPDSSDGEEACAFQKTLDDVVSQVVKESVPDSGMLSSLSALNQCVSRECCEEAGLMPLVRCFGTDSDLACPNNRPFKSSAEDEGIPKSNWGGTNHETQQIQNIVDVEIRTPIAIANILNINDRKTEQGNSSELVVRPKIRMDSTGNHLERGSLLPYDDEEESGSWRRTEIAEAQNGCAEYAWRNSKQELSSGVFFESRQCEGHQNNIEIDLRKNSAAQELINIQDNDSSWDEFEDCSGHFSMSHKDEDSSDCSDGEWSAAVLTYFTATERGQSSSDESWETVPSKEECRLEVQSSSSGVEEKNTDFCYQGREQTLLEEGEIPWLQYREEVESSSDEENDTVSDFVHLGFFLLDGNNNLEDDFSVSEDLDVEWSLLDEFGDGLGLAQAIPYMDPQFLTFTALERRLREAMETTLAHLESLGFDGEQTYPPATKETIDCLPQTIITDDYNGLEQCTICFCEYVKDEIITELPCHHWFHKSCVTRWLQESGTCPVCRHMLAPVLLEASAATVSFLPGHDSLSSVHSATGASE